MDDRRIVELIAARDEAGIAMLREKYGSRLTVIAKNICGDAETAEECVQDALLGAWNAIPPHDPGEYLFAFAAKIVRAAAVNRVKALGAQKRSAEFVELTRELESCIPDRNGAIEELEGAELSSAIGAFLRGKSELKRAVFVRRYWHADPLEDIAARYGITVGKVKSMLFRLRNELRIHLEKEGYHL